MTEGEEVVVEQSQDGGSVDYGECAVNGGAAEEVGGVKRWSGGGGRVRSEEGHYKCTEMI